MPIPFIRVWRTFREMGIFQIGAHNQLIWLKKLIFQKKSQSLKIIVVYLFSSRTLQVTEPFETYECIEAL